MNNASSQKIPVLDLYLASFQLLRGNPPELKRQGNKIIFEFNNSTVFSNIMGEYHGGAQVPAIEFARAIRQLRAMMLAARENSGGSRGEK